MQNNQLIVDTPKPYTMTHEQWKAAIIRCANARIKHILRGKK